MNDVDLMRRIMLFLEQRQRSPRQIVVLSLQIEADALDCTTEEAASALDHLLAIDYIDGPGFDPEGYFLFRKLTRRGVQFTEAARHPRDWNRLKAQYAGEAASA